MTRLVGKRHLRKLGRIRKGANEMRRCRVPVGLVFGTHLQGFVSDDASQGILIARHDDGDAFEKVGKGNGGGSFLCGQYHDIPESERSIFTVGS